jgi:hypothetical protein
MVRQHDLSFAVPVLGTDKKSIKCYAELGAPLDIAIPLIF